MDSTNVVPQEENTGEKDHSKQFTSDKTSGKMDGLNRLQASVAPPELRTVKETHLVTISSPKTSQNACKFKNLPPNFMVVKASTSFGSSSNLGEMKINLEKNIARIQDDKSDNSFEMKQEARCLEEKHFEKDEKEKAGKRDKIEHTCETDDHNNLKDKEIDKSFRNSVKRKTDQVSNALNTCEKDSKDDSHIDKLEPPCDIDASKKSEGTNYIDTVQQGISDKETNKRCGNSVESKIDQESNTYEKHSKNDIHLDHKLKGPCDIDPTKNSESTSSIESAQRECSEKNIIEMCASDQAESKQRNDLTKGCSRKSHQEDQREERIHEVKDRMEGKASGTVDHERETSKELVIESNSSGFDQMLSVSGAKFPPKSEDESGADRCQVSSESKVEGKKQVTNQNEKDSWNQHVTTCGDMLFGKYPGNIVRDNRNIDLAERNEPKDLDQKHSENLKEQQNVQQRRGRPRKPKTDSDLQEIQKVKKKRGRPLKARRDDGTICREENSQGQSKEVKVKERSHQSHYGLRPSPSIPQTPHQVEEDVHTGMVSDKVPKDNQGNEERPERETRHKKNQKEKEAFMRSILKALSDIHPSEFCLPTAIIGDSLKTRPLKNRKGLPIRAAANKAEGSYFEGKKTGRQTDNLSQPETCKFMKPKGNIEAFAKTMHVSNSHKKMENLIGNRKLVTKYNLMPAAKYRRSNQHLVYKRRPAVESKMHSSMNVKDGSEQRKKRKGKANTCRMKVKRARLLHLKRIRQMRSCFQKKEKQVDTRLTTSLGKYWDIKHEQRHLPKDAPESLNQNTKESESDEGNEQQSDKGRQLLKTMRMPERNVGKMNLRKKLKRPRDLSEYPRAEFPLKSRKVDNNCSPSFSENSLVRHSISPKRIDKVQFSSHSGQNLKVSTPSFDSQWDSEHSDSDATFSAFDAESYIDSDVGSPEIEIDVDAPSDYGEGHDYDRLPHQQIPDPAEDREGISLPWGDSGSGSRSHSQQQIPGPSEGINVHGNNGCESPSKTVQARKLPIYQRKLPNPSSEPVAVFYYNSEATMLRRCSKHHPCCQLSAAASAKVDSWTQWEDPDQLYQKLTSRRKSKPRDDLPNKTVETESSKQSYRKKYGKRWFTPKPIKKNYKQIGSEASNHVTQTNEKTSSFGLSSNSVLFNSPTPTVSMTQNISTFNSFSAAVPNLMKTPNSRQNVSSEISSKFPIHGLFTGSTIAMSPQLVQVNEPVFTVTGSPSMCVNSSPAVSLPRPLSFQLQCAANSNYTVMSQPAAQEQASTSTVRLPSHRSGNTGATTSVSSISTLAMNPLDVPQIPTSGIHPCSWTRQTLSSLPSRQTAPIAPISVRQFFMRDGALWLEGERNGKPIVRKVGNDPADYLVMKQPNGTNQAIFKVTDKISHNPKVQTVTVSAFTTT